MIGDIQKNCDHVNTRLIASSVLPGGSSSVEETVSKLNIRMKHKNKTHYREFVSNLEPLNDEAYFNDATEGILAKEIVGFSSTATPAELN